MNVLLLRGRGVSGVQDSARTSYWLQPVSKSSTWSPKQNKITRLRLAPHVCTVSTVGQIKPHFHPFRSCQLPTWCHSFWYKARNSFPTLKKCLWLFVTTNIATEFLVALIQFHYTGLCSATTIFLTCDIFTRMKNSTCTSVQETLLSLNIIR